MWISAAFIPGNKNKTADYRFRNFKDNTEWQLKSTILSQDVKILSYNPDLFSSYLNHQVHKYESWQPNPYSFAVDAFSTSWSTYTNVYAFPPFSLVGPVLTKLRQDKATRNIVIPYWTTQHWFPMMLGLLIEHPLILPNQKDTIQLPFRKDAIHPLYPPPPPKKKINKIKQKLLAVRLSGLDSKVLDYQETLKVSFCLHGDKQPEQSMSQYYEDGKHFVLKRQDNPNYRNLNSVSEFLMNSRLKIQCYLCCTQCID